MVDNLATSTAGEPKSIDGSVPAHALGFVEAFHNCLDKFGCVVIAVYPEGAALGIGDHPAGIWGDHLPPVPVVVNALATRRDWIKQNQFLVRLGAKLPDYAMKPGRGKRFFKCITERPQSAPDPEAAGSPDKKE